MPSQMVLEKDVQITEKGQVIISSNREQLFDNEAQLIDYKNSKIKKVVQSSKDSRVDTSATERQSTAMFTMSKMSKTSKNTTLQLSNHRNSNISNQF